MDKEDKNKLKEQYKAMKTWMGVYMRSEYTKTEDHDRASPNLKIAGLRSGSSWIWQCFNTEHQKEWKKFGPDVFATKCWNRR